MNVTLSSPATQVADKCRNLVPGLTLRNQDRNERVPQRVVTIQPLEICALDQFLEQPICSVTPALLDGSTAIAPPPLVATRGGTGEVDGLR